MLEAGVLPLLGSMMGNSSSLSAATALYSNLSCHEEAKSIIGLSEAVIFLLDVLQGETNPQCKIDSLHALYNLSSLPSNIPHLLSAGIINALQALIKDSSDRTWTKKSIALLINLASSKTARDDIISSSDLISGVSAILDIGEPIEQEQAVACLLNLCNGNDKCCQMVLQEGVIPSLVSISVNGTMRGKQKSRKLLMLFCEQRQREQLPVDDMPESSEMAFPPEESKPVYKSISKKKLIKNLSLWWKNKSFIIYQC